jgi:hypothetical protein
MGNHDSKHIETTCFDVNIKKSLINSIGDEHINKKCCIIRNKITFDIEHYDNEDHIIKLLGQHGLSGNYFDIAINQNNLPKLLISFVSSNVRIVNNFPNLLKMIFDNNTPSSINNVMSFNYLPSSLISLLLKRKSYFLTKINNFSNSINYLELSDIKISTKLPAKLLTIVYKYNSIKLNKIPTNVTKISIVINSGERRHKNFNIDKIILKKLKYLYFSNMCRVSTDNLPNTLKDVVCFENGFIKNTHYLPSSLLILMPGNLFRRNASNFVNSLKTIDFGDKFRHKILKVPKNIFEIYVSKKYKYLKKIKICKNKIISMTPFIYIIPNQ